MAPVVALGFEGGHGTAAGIKASFVQLGFPEGRVNLKGTSLSKTAIFDSFLGGDLALFAATIGLVSGVLFGNTLLNMISSTSAYNAFTWADPFRHDAD